jgi:hypothetical protein
MVKFTSLLKDFTPEEGRYDVIWIQWCIGQLTDDDFISFFNRAKVIRLNSLIFCFDIMLVFFVLHYAEVFVCIFNV